MKKTILATLGGMLLGLVLVIGVFAILHVQSGEDAVFAQNLVETIGFSEDDSAKKEEDELSIEGQIVLENTEKEDIEDIDSTEILEDVETSEDVEEEVDAPYYIRVNRSANCVTVYSKDENGDYTVPVKAMVCSVGLNNTTPLGEGEISDKYAWRLLFGNVYGQYAVRFDGHIMFHSVPYTTTSKDALKEGEYNLLGQPASQGCVRLCVADAKWIYDNCCAGTKVDVYDSEDPGPLGKPSSMYVDPYHFYRGWDPTDPDPANPWKVQGIVGTASEIQPEA